MLVFSTQLEFALLQQAPGLKAGGNKGRKSCQFVKLLRSPLLSDALLSLVAAKKVDSHVCSFPRSNGAGTVST